MIGEVIYYVYSTTPEGLTGCCGFNYYDEALGLARTLSQSGRKCCIRTFKCTREEVFCGEEQLSLFDEVLDEN